MSKSIINQRYIYKTYSHRFKYNNWSLNLDFLNARKNGEVVAVGDSIAFRMIRKMQGNLTTEEEINEIKKQIKKIKSSKNNKRNRELINKKYKELGEKTLIKEISSIMFDTIDDWKISNSKKMSVHLNGEKIRRLIGTSGGVKKSTVMFCEEKRHEELDRKLNNGRDITKKYVPAKFEAYKALAFSASTPVTQPKGVLVIKDGITKFKSDVIRLCDNGKGGFDLKEAKDYEIERQFTDGCGMICEKLSTQWTIDMGCYIENEKGEKQAEYISSGFNIRNAWCKGMVYTFPYIEFADEIDEYMVEDAWGNMQDIRNVELIITTNMLKLWDSYDSIEHYLQCCADNDFEFCVAKILPKELETVRNCNYQFLESYELSDEDIKEFIKPTVDSIKGAVSEDYIKMLLFLKGCKITEDDFLHEEYDFMKALMIEKEMAKDPFVRQRVYRMIEKRINDSKKGVLQMSANYTIVSGDLYGLCQWMFKKEVVGLLKANEFYSKSWIAKGVNKVVAFRAPMTIHNNIKIMNLIDNEHTRKWYRFMNTCTVINAWDTTMDAMNGEDMDGDANIITDSDVLLRNTKELPAVICEQNASDKKIIKENLLRDANKNGFNNDVGGVTNKCTGMYDVLSKFKKGTKEYKEMMYRITCMQGYQQEIIDSIKGIVPKQVPPHWYKYKDLKIKDTDTEEVKEWKLYNQKLGSFKKPYFFIYNYPKVMKKYKDYVDNNNINCLRKYGLTIDELKLKENKTTEEINFLNYYDLRMPVSMEKSTMNRICWELEKQLSDIKNISRKSNFDKNILKSNTRYLKSDYIELEKIYKEYKAKVRQYNATSSNLTKEIKKEQRGIFIEEFKNKVFSKCNNEDIVCNILVDMCYSNSQSKQFVWDICGDVIIENLLKRNNYKIHYPILTDDNNETEWNGQYYKLIEKEVNNEEDIKC